MKKKIKDCTEAELRKAYDNPRNGTKTFMVYAILAFGKAGTNEQILNTEVEI